MSTVPSAYISKNSAKSLNSIPSHKSLMNAFSKSFTYRENKREDNPSLCINPFVHDKKLDTCD
jgi:hypothetical protein